MTCVRCGQPASVTMLNLSVDEPEKPLCGPCGRREAEGWKQGSLLSPDAVVKAPVDVAVSGAVL